MTQVQRAAQQVGPTAGQLAARSPVRSPLAGRAFGARAKIKARPAEIGRSHAWPRSGQVRLVALTGDTCKQHLRRLSLGARRSPLATLEPEEGASGRGQAANKIAAIFAASGAAKIFPVPARRPPEGRPFFWDGPSRCHRWEGDPLWRQRRERQLRDSRLAGFRAAGRPASGLSHL